VETACGSGTTSAGAIEDASQDTKPQAQIFVLYRLVNRQKCYLHGFAWYC
jgi:hypothetical protein